MIYEAILAITITFAISALLYPVIIPLPHKLRSGQQVGEDKPQVHLKKRGTPTMGRLIILCGTIITSIFCIPSYSKIIPALFMTVGFGIIRFLNDCIKIVIERSEGLKPIQKLVRQLIITGIFAWYLLNSGETGTNMLIPLTSGFDGGKFLSLGIFFIPASSFIMLGTDNGVNLTDGLDRFYTSATILVATFLIIMTIGEDMGINPMAEAVVRSLLGFLSFNVYSAKVFMGDTGPLVPDGFVAAPTYMICISLSIPVIGPTHLVEVLSAVMQITYFKRIDGEHIFKMAPIHHHFKPREWSETRVVAVFAIVTAILCAAIYLGS